MTPKRTWREWLYICTGISKPEAAEGKADTEPQWCLRDITKASPWPRGFEVVVAACAPEHYFDTVDLFHGLRVTVLKLPFMGDRSLILGDSQMLELLRPIAKTAAAMRWGRSTVAEAFRELAPEAHKP